MFKATLDEVKNIKKKRDGNILKRMQKHEVTFQNKIELIFTISFLITNLIFWISYKNN